MKVAAYLTSLVTVASFGAALATGPAGAATPSAISTSALRYTPLSSPMRVADTRAGATDPATYAGKTLSAGTSLTVDIPKTVVPATAGAAVVNITATNPSGQGFLSVYPGGKTYATTSNVNFTKGQTVANLVTVGLGATQSFTVYDGPTTATGGGTVDFTADVEGYYSATGKSAYVATAPHRVYDSRANSGLPGAGMTLGAGKTDNVSVIATKTDGVPSTATGVVLNVGVTNTTASSYLEAYPTGAAPGVATSNQNWVAGETLSSQVISALGKTGQVTFKNYAGTADIVVDVDGYFTNKATTGALFTALAAPKRILTTRTATPLNGGSNSATAITTMTGATATAGVLDVIDLYQGTKAGGNFLTVYPKGTTPPVTANVNYTPSDTYNVVPNAAYGTAGATGDMSVYNGPLTAGKANVVVDEFGYFTPVVPISAVTVSATPATVAPNHASTIKAVVDHTGKPVATDAVLFSATGGKACGVISPALVETDAAGVATATYTAKTATTATAVGACTITVKEADYTMTGTTTVTTVVTDTVVVGAVTPLKDSASGAPSTEPVTATVTGPTGAVATATVDFTVTPDGTGGVCGTLSKASAKTKSTGVATVTYTAPTTAGFCTITATEAAVHNGEASPASGTAVVDNTNSVTATGATVPTVTVTATPKSVVAGGTSKVTVAVDTTGSTNPVVAPKPIVGDEVLLSTSGATGVCGTLSATSGVTSATGKVTVTYTASKTVGTCTIKATEASNGEAGAGTVTTTAAPNTASVTATPSTIKANATTTSTITAKDFAPTGAAATGTVTFSETGTCGTLGSTTVTLTNGLASTGYVSSTTAGFCTIKATFATTSATLPGTRKATIDQTVS